MAIDGVFDSDHQRAIPMKSDCSSNLTKAQIWQCMYPDSLHDVHKTGYNYLLMLVWFDIDVLVSGPYYKAGCSVADKENASTGKPTKR